MIRRLSHANVYVLDQERAKLFYTERLGLEVRTDIQLGPSFRWLTVGPKGQPDFEIVLVAIQPSEFMDTKTCTTLREMLEHVGLSAGVFETADCRKTYDGLVATGVQFVHAPSERPYGIEALFKDDSGNWFSLIQRRA